tara:strand:+ start:483 stop:1445 length:963 start_codon:yes stop_codon:yes gene_type:complete
VKSALVLGATGQDGSLMCKSLLRQNYKVIGFSRSIGNNVPNHKKLGIEKEVEMRSGNIEDFEIVEALIEKNMPDEIYNLAAQSSVGKSFSNPLETTQSIINGTINILEVSKKINYKGKIFFAGSSEIFGLTEQGATIDHIQRPNSPYGIAKQASMNLVKMYRKSAGLNCLTGILFNHESSLRDNKFVTKKIISEAIKCTKDKKLKFKLGNINVERDWGCAKEYVEAMQLMTRVEKIGDQIICTGKSTKLKDFIKIVFKELNLDWHDHIIIDKNLFRPFEISKSFGNPSKMFEDLNWMAKTNLEELISRMINEQLNEKELI